MESLGVPLLLIMMIWVGLKLPKVTGLKCARGRMPPLAVQQGASAMTSAEEFAAPLRDALTMWLQPRVVSASTRVYLLPPLKVTEPVKWSPGRTVSLKLTG